LHSNVIDAPGNLGRAAFAEELGITEDRAKEWISRGVLADLPRMPGHYSRADLAVGRVFLALQRIMGERSDKVVGYARQLAPKVWHSVKAGESKRVIVRISIDGVVVDVYLTIHADGRLSSAPSQSAESA
jgi:hypothetical protein